MALSQLDAPCSADGYTGPSADEYRRLAADIDADCKSKADEMARRHAAYLKELEDECLRQKRILAGKEEDHAEEKADVKKQADVVAKEKMDVKKARVTVKELAHCPPELAEARQELGEQEAIPNESASDIDAECKAQKLVLEKEACVEELRAAEGVLSGQKDEHSGEKSDLGHEENEEDHAASKLPPQERRVEEACRLFDEAKKKGPPTNAADELNKRCQAKKDALSKEADAAIEALLNDYLRQKKILEGKEADHVDEKEDVDGQKNVVAEEKLDVKAARVTVKNNAHCPPELEKANDELSTQRKIPNDTSEDINAECVARKAVMEAEQCVEALRKAEAVLVTEKGQHGEEKSDLKVEKREEDQAAAAVPPQEKIVCELKAALDAARAARKGLTGGESSSSSSSSKAEPEKKEAEKAEAESGNKKSAAAKSTTVGVAVFVAALYTFLQA